MASAEKNNEKKCVDQKPGSICGELYPSLNITWGGFDGRYSRQERSKETSDEEIKKAKSSRVNWLRVTGKCKISDLSPEVDHEVVLKVKLGNVASGLELFVSLLLLLPDGTFRQSRMDLLKKHTGQGMELNMGSFSAKKEETGELEFDLNTEGDWDAELNIKEAIIRPISKRPKRS